MVKLPYLTLVPLSILVLHSIKITSANATDTDSQLQQILIAQNSSGNEDEMLDALQKREDKLENIQELKKIKDLVEQEKVNQQILDNLQQEKINISSLEELAKVQKIIEDENLSEEDKLEQLRQENINIDNLEQLQKIQQIFASNNAANDDSEKLSGTMAFKMLTIGIPSGIILLLIASKFSKGIIEVIKSNYQQKFGKPPIPERSLNLHNTALKEVVSFGRKAEKIDDDKFSNDEFKVLINFKVDVSKGIEGYQELNYKVELLRAAIIAQKSFLKLEATELRYRSRKQQEFYQYIADNLEEDLDKEAFAKKIKKKETEILPLINTEEGREAIHSYSKEMNEISKHELGLKLLALFKKYDLKDFSVIREISQVVEGLQGHDLLEPKRLIITVKEYYDLFDKIAPILEVPKNDSSAATYAQILQIVGLLHRHSDAYTQFRELIRLLRKWEQPYETVTMIREQFNSREYSIPQEFEQKIPGIMTHEKYVQYLESLS